MGRDSTLKSEEKSRGKQLLHIVTRSNLEGKKYQKVKIRKIVWIYRINAKNMEQVLKIAFGKLDLSKVRTLYLGVIDLMV